MSLKRQSVLVRSRLRPYLVFAFVMYVAISHVFLPIFNERQDFLFFFTWDMFSGPAKTRVVDLTWDEGKSFFFRDHLQKAKNNNLDVVVLYHLLNGKDVEKIKTDFKFEILNLCDCSRLELYSLAGSTYDHIVLKSPLEVIERESL